MKSAFMAAGAILLLTSCGGRSRAGMTAGGAASASRNMKLAAPRMMADMAAPEEVYEMAAMPSTEAPAFGEMDGGVASVAPRNDGLPERKLVYSADITIEVADLAAAEENIAKQVEAAGGYVANSSRSDMMLSVDMKVPARCFDETVESVQLLGRLVDRNVNASDVTDRYYDLDSRIRTKEILKERLESYLKTSGNMKDLVAVETQLNSVISDLEAMQGQFKRLSNQIDYSNISVRFVLPAGKNERGWKWPSVSGKVRGFALGAAGFFSTLLLVILGIALFGTPVVLIAALLYCLTFGKVGWVRKLFWRMSPHNGRDG